MQRRRFLAGLGAFAGATALLSVPVRSAPAIPDTRHERLDGLTGRGRELRSRGAGPSGAVEAPMRFTMLGFELPDGAEELRVRTSDDGEDWSAWATLGLLGAVGEHADDDHDDPAPARMTPPLWVGRARWLEVDGVDPSRVGVELIDSDGASAGLGDTLSRAGRSLAGAGARPARASGAPTVISRSQWGADESWRGGSTPLRLARAAAVHHTAETNHYGPDESAGIVRGIYRYHARSLGWSDIGYNLLVDRYGQVFEGRAGGIEQAVIGAHAAGFNTDTIGVAVLGSFGSSAVPPDAEDAVAETLGWIFARHRIDPRAEVVLLSRSSNRFARGAELATGTLVGHRELGWTSCPGDRLDARLGALHERATEHAEAQAGPARLGQAEGDPAAGPIDRLARRAPATLSAAAAAWFWTSATTVVIASAEDFPDALAGAAVAAEHDAPLLLTDPDRLSSDVADRIRQLGPARAVVLGGTAAVADGVADELDDLVLVVERLAGDDRFETAAEIAREVGAPAGDVAICLGRHEEARRAWPDAVSAGALAATSPRVPILLTEQDEIPDATLDALDDLGPSRAFIVGGTAAIDPVVERLLAARGLATERLAGDDRYATSLEVARETRSRLPGGPARLVFASGEEFTHAVIAGGVAARRGGSLILLPRSDLGSATEAYLREARGQYDDGVVLGDAGTISDRVRWQLNMALTG